MLLAEAISLDGGELLVILVILVVLLAGTVAIVVAGCVWAYRVGRGSQDRPVGLVVVLAVEGLVLLASLAALADDSANLSLIFPAGALLAQGLAYAWGRRRATTTGSSGR